MKGRYVKEELLDNYEGPIQYYTLQDYLQNRADSPDNTKRIVKGMAIAYIFTLGVLYCCYPLTRLVALMILDIFVAPGVYLLVMGVYSFFPSSHQKIELDPELKKVTAIVTDRYRLVEESTHVDPEASRAWAVTYNTILDCTYKDVHYKLLRRDNGAIDVKTPEIGDKKTVYLDIIYPEKSVLEDDLLYAENGSVGASLFAVLFGFIWVGMFVLAAILENL